MFVRTLIFGIALAVIAPILAHAQESAPLTSNKVVLADTRTLILAVTALNPDCTLFGAMKVRVRKDAQHGKVEVVDEGGFPNYPIGNPRSACNKREVQMTKIYYTGAADYDGKDALDVEIFSPTGTSQTGKFNIVVKK
jgi:hypothetical protein